MKYLFGLALVLSFGLSFGQTDNQWRYNSNSRQFFIWNEEKQTYELKDTEEEHSVIDIREQINKNAGYAIVSMTDDAKTRMFHGNIVAYKQENGESIWSLRSRVLKSRIVLNPEKHTLTFSYEANGERYMKIFVFKLELEN